MSDTPLAQPTGETAAAIPGDAQCVICGYNLRGLKPDGRCPECGSPVARSVHGNLLRYADPNWLERILLSVRLLLWSILMTILLTAGAGIAGGLGAPPMVIVLAQLAVSGLDLAAAILLTTQEPRIFLSEDTVTLRKVIRACAVSTCVGKLLSAMSEGFESAEMLAIIGGVLSLAAIVVYFGNFVYLRRFALRIPNAKLASSTRTVMWGLLICVGMAFVCGLGAAIAAASAASFGPGLFGVSMCVVGACALVFGIWYLILLFDYRNALRTAIAEARSFELRTGSV